MALTILDTVDNQVGTRPSRRVRLDDPAVPRGATQVAVAATMTAKEAADPAGAMCIDLFASTDGLTEHCVLRGVPWVGGPGKSPPSVAWSWKGGQAPAWVRAEACFLTQCVAGLSATFS